MWAFIHSSACIDFRGNGSFVRRCNQAGKFKLWRSIEKRSTRRDHPEPLPGVRHIGTLFNEERTRAAEIPSANGHASARGEEITTEIVRCCLYSSPDLFLFSFFIERFKMLVFGPGKETRNERKIFYFCKRGKAKRQ